MSTRYENVVAGIRRRWQTITVLKPSGLLVELSCGHEIEIPDQEINGNKTFACPFCRSRHDGV